MKFKSGDILTKKLFLEACNEIDEKCKKLDEGVQMPSSFSSAKEAEQYFRSIGGITIEEFDNKIKEEFGMQW